MRKCLILVGATMLLLLATAASAQLTQLTDYYQMFGYGLTVGTNVTTNLPGTLRWNAAGTNLQVHNDSTWVDIGSGSGSGFPMTADGDMAGFSLYGGGTITVTNGIFANLVSTTNLLVHDIHATNLLTTNLFAHNATFYDAITAQDATFDDTVHDDVTVNGDLTVLGVQNINTTVNHTTNYYFGGTTTIVNDVVYTTQYLAYVTNIIYYSTNNVETYVDVGGTWDSHLAEWVWLPGLYIDNSGGTSTNYASNHWDFTSATVDGLDIDFPETGLAESHAYQVPDIGGVYTIWGTNYWKQSVIVTSSVATVQFARVELTNSADWKVELTAGANAVTFYTNNLHPDGFDIADIFTDGTTNIIIGYSDTGDSNVYWNTLR